MGRPLVLVLVLLGACKETGVLKEIEDPREYDGYLDSDAPVNDEELPGWPGGRPRPGTGTDTDRDFRLPPHTGRWRPQPYPETGGDTDVGGPYDTDTGAPVPGDDSDPPLPTDDPYDTDTDAPYDTDTDAPYDTDTDAPYDTDTDAPYDTDTDAPYDTDAPGDTDGDTDTFPGTILLPDTDPVWPDTDPTPPDETGLWVADTDGTPPVLTPSACRKAASIAGFLDRFQIPGDGKVQFCHRSSEGKWVSVDASTSACLAHASHLLDIFPTTLCDY